MLMMLAPLERGLAADAHNARRLLAAREGASQLMLMMLAPFRELMLILLAAFRRLGKGLRR